MKKKILNISPWIGPPYNGANINRYMFIKQLSKDYDCRNVFIVGNDQIIDGNIYKQISIDLGGGGD